MKLSRRSYHLVTLFVLLLSGAARAQNAPIGAWESLLSYTGSMGLAASGNTLYALSSYSFFSLNSDHSYTTYSKTDGMGDMGMQCTAYDVATATLVLVYTNNNIDLFRNNTFYHIPDLKLRATGRSKIIHQVYTDNGMAYVVTDVGIEVIDIAKGVIENTIDIFVPGSGGINTTQGISALVRCGNYFYAATTNGIYKADKDRLYIPGPTVWQQIDSTHAVLEVTAIDDKPVFASANSVYKLQSDTLALVYRTSKILRISIRHIDAANNNSLLISEYSDSTATGAVKTLTKDNMLSDSLVCAGKPQQAVQMPDNSIWIADSINGLQKGIGGVPQYYVPDGPSNIYSFDIYANNRQVYVAHGGYNQLLGANFTTYGISRFSNEKWKLYEAPAYPALGQARDIIALTKDETTGNVYGASYLNGLVTIRPNDSVDVLNDKSIYDAGHIYAPQFKQVIGITLDKHDNLWTTLVYSDHQLYVKTKDNNWRKFKVPKVSLAGPVLSDDNGRIFFISLQNGDLLSGGVEVFDYNGTLDDTTDDASYHMKAGKGYGNLPNNDVRCMAKDNNNDVWVGTVNGVGIIPNCTTPLTQSQPCEATIPIVSATNEALLWGKTVNSIAVDDANRKWIGTDDGVMLVSADGQNVLYKFTADNSPLPSDHVQKIAIDHATGDVYFGTYSGIVSFRATITSPAADNDNVLIFPNPVPAGYKGPIAMRDLMLNADIKITDINGQLVYHTTVNAGGQVTWNGNDYTGHRIQSGVYLVFISDSGGKHIKTGKIVFIQ